MINKKKQTLSLRKSANKVSDGDDQKSEHHKINTFYRKFKTNLFLNPHLNYLQGLDVFRFYNSTTSYVKDLGISFSIGRRPLPLKCSTNPRYKTAHIMLYYRQAIAQSRMNAADLKLALYPCTTHDKLFNNLVPRW